MTNIDTSHQGLPKLFAASKQGFFEGAVPPTSGNKGCLIVWPVCASKCRLRAQALCQALQVMRRQPSGPLNSWPCLFIFSDQDHGVWFPHKGWAKKTAIPVHKSSTLCLFVLKFCIWDAKLFKSNLSKQQFSQLNLGKKILLNVGQFSPQITADLAPKFKCT